jgi:hypothetical protein
MESKAFEVVGRGHTFYAVVATKFEGATQRELKILQSRGAGKGSVLISRLDSGLGNATEASHRWGDDFVMEIASNYISENFDSLNPGDVIDTEVINGDTSTPKKTQFP